MIVTPLPAQSPQAFSDALRAHGWDAERARELAAGMASVAFHLQPLDPDALEALVVVAGRSGLEVVTGPDWALLSGARSRCAIFGRPWTLPQALAGAAVAIARALPEDDPRGDA